jgi:hypothetical protein
MLNYILSVDEENEEEDNHYSPAFYIGKDISYIRKVYEEYICLEGLNENEQIQNGYYKLEIE